MWITLIIRVKITRGEFKSVAKSKIIIIIIIIFKAFIAIIIIVTIIIIIIALQFNF